MDRLLLVLADSASLLLLLVLLSVRREHIRVEYSVSWLVAAERSDVGLVQPHAFCHGSRGMMGIEYPPLVVIVFMFGAFLRGAFIAFRCGSPS